MTPIYACYLAAFIFCQVNWASGHGYTWKPVARASAWRKGFNTPIDYTDDEFNCGGYGTQWDINHGKCGICGDPWNGPKKMETPGRFATGTIVETYKEGQVMDVEIQVTTNHHGWFEFRICENNDIDKDKDQSCFDKHLLEFEGGGTRIKIEGGAGLFKYRLRLPKGVTCEQCILQWHWNCASNWGCDKDTGKCCQGCGPQETFWGCSDIKIVAGNPNATTTNRSYEPTTSTNPPMTTKPGPCHAIPPI